MSLYTHELSDASVDKVTWCLLANTWIAQPCHLQKKSTDNPNISG